MHSEHAILSALTHMSPYAFASRCPFLVSLGAERTHMSIYFVISGMIRGRGGGTSELFSLAPVKQKNMFARCNSSLSVIPIYSPSPVSNACVSTQTKMCRSFLCCWSHSRQSCRGRDHTIRLLTHSRFSFPKTPIIDVKLDDLSTIWNPQVEHFFSRRDCSDRYQNKDTEIRCSLLSGFSR